MLRLISATSNVALAKPEEAVLDAMIEGWSAQQRSRGLREDMVRSRRKLVTRLCEHSGHAPWEWTPADVESFTVDLAAAGRHLSTLRGYHGSIRMFCEYLISPHYDWVEICEAQFGTVPSQVCLPWNTIAHRFAFEGDGSRRPLTYDEVETLFNTADARVDDLVASGRKGALSALRDAQLLKTVYAFGLRRTEAVSLDLADLHHSSMRSWGRYGALYVRWGKAAGGGAPKRRTVLLVPEFDWWVPGMQQWVEEARPRFAGRDLPGIWVTERRTRVSPGYLDRRFSDLRDAAGLDRKLTLHSLRHSFATHLLEFGYAERFVQEQLGHEHASTTSIYASVSSDYKNRLLAHALKNLLESEGPQ
ncbi:tyrosine-type recombinase/integrase [Microbacterium jejuense]|uniref:tyrosine-type recombinase/integrase n=1 Tax=Microbacterium jejuense TaxID=1263637 RepID=UPI0027E387D3|nr:tyrosine-type recombinase/integrase [Microbacterium jejuense]